MMHLNRFFYERILLYLQLNLAQLEDGETSEQASNKSVLPRILAECMSTITAIQKADGAEAEMVAFETIFDAHHPCLGEFE